MKNTMEIKIDEQQKKTVKEKITEFRKQAESYNSINSKNKLTLPSEEKGIWAIGHDTFHPHVYYSKYVGKYTCVKGDFTIKGSKLYGPSLVSHKGASTICILNPEKFFDTKLKLTIAPLPPSSYTLNFFHKATLIATGTGVSLGMPFFAGNVKVTLN